MGTLALVASGRRPSHHLAQDVQIDLKASPRSRGRTLFGTHAESLTAGLNRNAYALTASPLLNLKIKKLTNARFSIAAIGVAKNELSTKKGIVFAPPADGSAAEHQEDVPLPGR